MPRAEPVPARLAPLLVSAAVAFALPGPPASGQAGCQPDWLPTFGGAVGVNAGVAAMAVYDDGNGPALYVGGSFKSAGGVAASRIARWDGHAWSNVGGGVGWVGFGGLSDVSALAVFDDGSGPALYAGGDFNQAGGVPAGNIAKWNGTSWSAVGSGIAGKVYELAVHDDGSGPALYAGGNFTTAGVVRVDGIGKWDGLAWSALGDGVEGFMFEPGVADLATFDDGGGAALYVGGAFTSTPGGDGFIAKWGRPAIEGIPGCAGNPATLSTQASGAPLGSPLPLRITGSAAASGLGLVYFGAPGFDAAGCGLIAPGIGELLLAFAPSPVLVASGSLASGICDLAPPVPSQPSLIGVTAHLQGAAIDLALASPIEPTNALAVTLGP